MSKKIVTLTEQFNEATVNRGDTFRISLQEGGFISMKVEEISVVSGKASLIKAPPENRSTGCGAGPVKWVYKAEETGTVEIVAKTQFGQSTFKVHVN